MIDLLDGKMGAIKTLHSWTRYRAHLHCVDIKRGPVIVPLNRINTQFEYLEEVRFEKFQDTTIERGLLGYINEYWNIKYDTELSSNETHIVHELYKETGLCPIPVQRQNRHYPVLGNHFIAWYNYFPSYVASGIRMNRERKILYSPYPDEVERFSGFTIERLPPYAPGGKPRVQINAKL